MSQKEIAYKIDELFLKAEIVNSLQCALFAAIFRQSEYSEKEFEWAFVQFGNQIFDLMNEIEDLRNSAFDALRKEEKISG